MSNFLGSHAINMDAKGRLAIPTKVREELAQLCGGRIVLTANADEEHCLLLYPEPAWETLRPQIEALPNMNKAARRLQRLILGNAAPMELDSAGRILVPPTLRHYAHLEKKLMLIGQGKNWSSGAKNVGLPGWMKPQVMMICRQKWRRCRYEKVEQVSAPGFRHRSVLLDEAVDHLVSDPSGRYVDATFGRGGHSRLILSQLSEQGELLGIDKDPEAIVAAGALATDDARFCWYHGSFSELSQALDSQQWPTVNGVLMDLGVSSPQLDDAARGFRSCVTARWTCG